ncbi:MAG: ornithine carbamoyltransferase, partial [Thermoleophilia bacterium]|nr:ornithine carbamoyltransferase [Thermoleophilia bacterium]
MLTLENHSPDAIQAVLELALELKGTRPWPHWLADRVVALIFERPSTRTRVSFQSGIARLGGTPMILSSADLQLGRGETVEDTARVLARMVDAIVIRTGPHSMIEELDAGAEVPVINGLTYDHHPCQALADALTLRERFEDLRGLRVAYVGDGNNVCSSLMIMAGLTGMHLTCGCPPGYAPDAQIAARSDARARQLGGSVLLVEDPREA